MPALAPTPRFEHTYCSQCGRDLGPGNAGLSHCQDHRRREDLADQAREVRRLSDRAAQRGDHTSADQLRWRAERIERRLRGTAA